jgi:PH domain.
MSFESEMSEDYAIPPDALSCSGDSLEWYSLVLKNSNYANVGSPCRLQKGIPPSDISIDKSGYLVKLGGKLKTWRRRWFQLNNGKLHYWKSQV